MYEDSDEKVKYLPKVKQLLSLELAFELETVSFQALAFNHNDLQFIFS